MRFVFVPRTESASWLITIISSTSFVDFFVLGVIEELVRLRIILGCFIERLLILIITMPLYNFACGNGHIVEHFVHVASDLGCQTHLCPNCVNDSETGAGTPMFPIFSFGRGLTYFSEKSPRTIWNLGPEPVTIRSPEEHKAAMKKAGVEWHPPKRGMPGCWGG